ncbi:MAG: hypothetical protein ACE5HU_09205 [Acidobacteriota bacterium]
MIEMLKKFLWDETAAKGYIRSIMLFAGAMMATGQIDWMPPWAGALMMAAAGMVRAGDPNPEHGG